MIAFVVVVPQAAVEIAADRLFGLGVVAVEERASDLDGHVELWTAVGDDAAAVAAAGAALGSTWSWRTVPLDESVADSWRRHAVPIPVSDDVVIVPTWLAEEERAATGTARPILIDPGAAFGMGDHPTTRLTLVALLGELERRPAPVSVLDVGCGSGVLAIAAAQRGARPVVAIDVAAAAIEATDRNSLANGVHDVVRASTTPLVELDARFEVVLANVLAPDLIAMAADLRRVVAPGGVLVISGILAERHDHVLAALLPLRPMSTATADGWAAVTLQAD